MSNDKREVAPVSPPQCKICGKFEGDLIHAKDEKGIFTAFGHRSHAFEVAPVSPKLPRHSCHITEQGHLLEPCDACAKEKADMATGKFTADPSNPKQLECRCWCGRECGCGCHDGTPERVGAEGYVGHDPHGTQYTHGFIPREAQPASATTLMSAEQYEIVWRKAKGLSQLLGLRRSEWLQFALSYAEYWAAQSLSAQSHICRICGFTEAWHDITQDFHKFESLSAQTPPAIINEDGSTLPRDAEWCEALNGEGVQVESFRPIEVINVYKIRFEALSVELAEKLRKAVYDFWKLGKKPDFGQASTQALLRDRIAEVLQAQTPPAKEEK